MRRAKLIQRSINVERDITEVTEPFEAELNGFLEKHQHDDVRIEGSVQHCQADRWNSFSVLVSWETPDTQVICPQCETGKVTDGDYLCEECR